MGVVFWQWPKATLMIAGMLSYLLLYAGVENDFTVPITRY